MGRTARLVGGTSIVLAPLVAGIGGALLAMARPENASEGIVNTEYGVQSQLADIAAVERHEGLFTAGSALLYVSTLLMIPALLAVWRLSVGRAPRWAWTGAVMAMLGVVGHVVHLTYFAHMLAAVEAPDRRGTAEFLLTLNGTPFLLALFVPYFLAVLGLVPQAVGLRRAGVIPRWAAVALVAGAVVSFTGSAAWTLGAVTILLVAGFGPAAIAMLRGRPAVAERGAGAGVAVPA